MTKALFFDIDGTLVSFETHRIPTSTIEALEAAHAKGHKIFIATGRPKAIINNLSATTRPESHRWIHYHERGLLFCRRASYL